MDGKTLIVQTVVGLAPYSLFSPADGRFYGMDVDIAKVLAGKLNFQLRMKRAKSWDGIEGDVSTTVEPRFSQLFGQPKKVD